jgi:hypothetical protein
MVVSDGDGEALGDHLLWLDSGGGWTGVRSGGIDTSLR